MSRVHKVATVQFEPTMFEKARNIARLLELCEAAATAGARLIVTPEMGITGYCWFDRAEVAPFVETIPGLTTDRFAALARKHDCYIVVGMPETDSDEIYFNCAVLIGPEGVVGRHRKTHPYISEPKWAAAGDLGHQVFDTPIGRIALLICMDIHFVETARLVALEGADVICHISNLLAERAPAPYWISRAFENGCYLIESNRWGLERTVQFSGGSCVIAPDGTITAVIDGGDGFALAEMDLDAARARCVGGEAVFAQRRPELYAGLLSDTFSWNPRDFFKLYGHKPWPPGRTSRVTVAEMRPGDDVEANLACITSFVRQAKLEDEADLVVFPELAVSGLTDPGARAQAVPGPITDRLCRLAAQLKMYLAVGVAERDRDAIYNSACLIGPEGLVAVYRKTHLMDSERAWASPGDAWIVADTRVGRIGLLIGHDASFPEAGRILALSGCDLIVCPAAMKERFSAPHPGSLVPQSYPIGAVQGHLPRAAARNSHTDIGKLRQRRVVRLRNQHTRQTQGFGLREHGLHFPVQTAIRKDEQAIQLGRDFGDTVEVTAGLSPQDQVIDSPPETLQSGDAVQVGPATSSAPKPAGKPNSPATE